MKAYHLIIASLLVLVTITDCFGQVEVKPEREHIKAEKGTDLFKVTVVNKGSLNITGMELTAELSKDGFVPCYSVKGNIGGIAANENRRISYLDLSDISEISNDSMFRSYVDTNKSLLPGSYTLQYTVKTSDGAEYLSTAIYYVEVDSIKENKERKWIAPYGELSATSFFQFADITTPNVPTNYQQVTAFAGVSLFDFLPVGGRASLLFEEGRYNTGSSNYAFVFDAAKYREGIKEKVLEGAKAQLEKENKILRDLGPSLSELNRVEKILNNKGVQDEISKLAELEVIESLLRDSIWNRVSEKDSCHAYKNALDTVAYLKGKLNDGGAMAGSVDSLGSSKAEILNSLKQKYEALKFLKQKKKYYDDLVNKKDELSSKLGAADSLKEKYLSYANGKDLNDPNQIAGLVKNSDQLSKYEKWLYLVNDFKVGQLFPSYSDLVLQNSSLSGFQLGLTPGKYSLTYLQGKTTGNSFYPGQQERKLKFIAGGYGNPESKHIHAGLLSGSQSLVNNPELNSLQEHNLVLFTKGQTTFLENHIKLYGELAGSELSTGETKDFFSSMGNVFTQSPETGGLTGLAFRAGSLFNLFKGNTEAGYAYQFVSRDYSTYGNPLLLDQNFHELTISQKLFKQALSLKVMARRRESNQSDNGNPSYTFWHFGGEALLNIEKLPQLGASIQPIFQSTPSGNMQGLMYNIRANYKYRISKVRNLLLVMYNRTRYSFESLNGKITNEQISCTGTSLLSKTSSLNYSYLYTITNGDTISAYNHTITLGASQKLFKSQMLTLGASISKGHPEDRLGGFGEWSWSIKSFATLGVRGTYNTYQSYAPDKTFYGQSNREWLLQISSQFRW